MVTLKHIEFKSARGITLLSIESLHMRREERWAITGSNGSGKSLLAQLVSTDLEPTSGEILRGGNPSYVAFERQEAIMEEERKRDDSRYLDLDGAENPGRTVTQWVSEDLTVSQEKVAETILLLGLERAAERGLRYLSTGEFRKTMLCRALLEKSDYLVLDDPYEGLDKESSHSLRDLIAQLTESGRMIIVVSGRREDFPEGTTHLLILEEGRAIYSGLKKKGIELLDKLKESGKSALEIPYNIPPEKSAHPILMKKVNVAYEEKKILTDLNWQVEKGDKWLLTGPNGAGKSTLLSLINGDNPKAYGNDITLFGQKKGSGETIWELKKRIGYISGDFQMNYRVRSTLLGVVLSGFFDSVGLYSQVSESQKRVGQQWGDFCGLGDKINEPFEKLSFGEKRMALIARAMIKSPQLLILDEPCQGLDERHRDQVLALCERIGSLDDLTMLYVTHSQHNTPACLTKHISLVPHGDGGFTDSFHQEE